MTRCDWCIGFIRRDCKMMQRCVKTRLPRSERKPSDATLRMAETMGCKFVSRAASDDAAADDSSMTTLSSHKYSMKGYSGE